MTDDVMMRHLPQYVCHKKVWAMKIKEVRSVDVDDSMYYLALIPEEEGYAPICPPREYFSKHEPQAGGYYVVYEDGYESFSPAEPFEKGYTRYPLRLADKLFISLASFKFLKPRR